MLRNSEEHGCLVLDRGSEAQRSWSSAHGRGISLSPGVHLGVTDEVMGTPQTYRPGRGKGIPAVRISIFGWSKPLWRLRGMWKFGGQERGSTKPSSQSLEGSACPSPPPSEITSFICDSTENNGMPIPGKV